MAVAARDFIGRACIENPIKFSDCRLQTCNTSPKRLSPIDYNAAISVWEPALLGLPREYATGSRQLSLQETF